MWDTRSLILLMSGKFQKIFVLLFPLPLFSLLQWSHYKSSLHLQISTLFIRSVISFARERAGKRWSVYFYRSISCGWVLTGENLL